VTDRKLRKAAPGQVKMVTAKGNNAAKRTVDHLSQQGWQLNTDIMTACFTVWAILLFPIGLLYRPKKMHVMTFVKSSRSSEPDVNAEWDKLSDAEKAAVRLSALRGA
jgi:hypothetical protein